MCGALSGQRWILDSVCTYKINQNTFVKNISVTFWSKLYLTYAGDGGGGGRVVLVVVVVEWWWWW